MSGTSTVTRRQITVPLFQGDDRYKLEELLAEVQMVAGADAGPRRIGDASAEATEAVERYNTFLREAESRATIVKVEALKRTDWREAKKRHTTTEVDENGVETETIDHEGLADDIVPRCIIEPILGAVERAAFVDELSDPDFDRIYSAAVIVNMRQGVVNPKELSISDVMRLNEETSSSLGLSESASESSSDTSTQTPTAPPRLTEE